MKNPNDLSLCIRKLAGYMLIVSVWLGTAATVSAEFKLPALFTDHMVLQREMSVRIWGWADPSERIHVSFGEQSVTGQASKEGRWVVNLKPMPASRDGRTLLVRSAAGEQFQIEDVLVGEVWLCSGQSNMEFPVSKSYDGDLEIAAAKHPMIRLISVPKNGTQELQDNFEGQWEVCSPQTVSEFSAVGYLFGRELNAVLDVPIGLIDNAWGGSSAEAWVQRDLLEEKELYQEYVAHWKQIESTYDYEAILAGYRKRLATWDANQKLKKNASKRPKEPGNRLATQWRPGNLYAGVLHPLLGYGIRGVIWYQGESNAKRAWAYRELFPLLIQHWRQEWGQGDFSFYWSQLAGHKEHPANPEESWWAELREAQTLTMDLLPNTGQAVIYDVGEAHDIHPRSKLTVGRRLARLALANDYGVEIPCRSARFESMEIKGNQAWVTFKDVGQGGLYVRDSKILSGFSVAGDNGEFVWATARLAGKNRVHLTAKRVENPVYVRYAWADNPDANLYTDRMGPPVTPFRTDELPVSTLSNRL
jgi:sialate O-acetylesterase